MAIVKGWTVNCLRHKVIDTTPALGITGIPVLHGAVFHFCKMCIRDRGAKYRKEKRDMASSRMQELEDMEMAESKVLKITEFVTANELALSLIHI